MKLGHEIVDANAKPSSRYDTILMPLFLKNFTTGP
jgi:hypothetical protein